MSGLPATGTSGFGMRSVIGRMRSPRPAASTMAFMRHLPAPPTRAFARGKLAARSAARRTAKVARAPDSARTCRARIRSVSGRSAR